MERREGKVEGRTEDNSAGRTPLHPRAASAWISWQSALYVFVLGATSLVLRARATGGTITQEPTDAVLEGDPPVPVRYSFCEGPDGEQIELLQADVL